MKMVMVVVEFLKAVELNAVVVVYEWFAVMVVKTAKDGIGYGIKGDIVFVDDYMGIVCLRL